jgi:hypothetical protein
LYDQVTRLWEPFRGSEIVLKLNGNEACCGSLRSSVSCSSRAPADLPEMMCLIVISSIVSTFGSLSMYERGLMESTKLLELTIKHHFWPIAYCKKCPECAIVTVAGRQHQPPLHPIHVQKPFQIVGVDIVDLACTESGNKHEVVSQDTFTKWPMVYAMPDQKTETREVVVRGDTNVVPFFGVLEALLSDRGTNLLSHPMLDICKSLGITKLNTTH